MPQDTDPHGVRNRARKVRSGLTATVLSLLLVVVLERLGYAGAWRGSLDGGRAAAELALSIPSLINLAALWQLRTVAAAVANGDLFGRAVVAGLRRMGALLAASAAVSMLVIPVLVRAFGMSEVRLIDADVSTLILGAIGLGLVLIATLIERAGLAQRELEEFF